IGNDPDNEVLIFAGSADEWIAAQFDANFPSPAEAAKAIAGMPSDPFYDQIYADATKLLESFIFNIDIPTIACINGPGSHTEVALMCDITLCAEHTELFDP